MRWSEEGGGRRRGRGQRIVGGGVMVLGLGWCWEGVLVGGRDRFRHIQLEGVTQSDSLLPVSWLPSRTALEELWLH